MRRRALLIGVPGGGINVSLAAERLMPLLEDLGFGVARCIGGRAHRDTVLSAIDRLISQTQPGDTCFVHYFGHGGRITFTDLEGPFAGTIFGYVSTIKESPSGGFAAILDVELSARFAELDKICSNVTVMLDCCYSAELVRTNDASLSNHYYSVPTPDLLREYLARPQPTLALDSHPRIVRLCGTSAKREAYATLRQGRNIGHMTDAFIDILTQRNPTDIERICWGTVVHDLRERVIERLKFEGQWVALAGPRNRLLFSRSACEMPGTVSFVAHRSELGAGWLRAGWLQGVVVGDRWAVLDIAVDGSGQLRVLTEGTVSAVERNRARLELAEEVELPRGSPAFPVAIQDAMGVCCEATSATSEAIERSAWLKAVDEDQADAALRGDGATFSVEDLRGSHPPLGGVDPPRAIELLEQRARVRALLSSLADHEPDPCPLEWSCWLVGAETPLPESGAELRVGDRLRVEIHYPRKPDDAPDEAPPNWFSSVVLIEADGHARLLNARMPEGLELYEGELEHIGVRAGQRTQGFELRWPEGIDAPSAPVSVVMLASLRMIQLGHIVREQPLDEDQELVLAGLFDAVRTHGPRTSSACAWARFEFTLHRAPGPLSRAGPGA